MARLALATHNAHKVDEIWAILAPLVPGLSRDVVASAGELGAPSPVEDGTSFAENALIKARALAASSGLPAIADGGVGGTFSMGSDEYKASALGEAQEQACTDLVAQLVKRKDRLEE